MTNPSYNYDDKLNEKHSNGITLNQMVSGAQDATNPPGLVSDLWKTQRAVNSYDMDPRKAHYKDGNGVENEKLDAYWHIAHNADDAG